MTKPLINILKYSVNLNQNTSAYHGPHRNIIQRTKLWGCGDSNPPFSYKTLSKSLRDLYIINRPGPTQTSPQKGFAGI